MYNTWFYGRQLHTGLQIITQPDSEPVTLAQAKAQARVELDFTLDDDLINALITAARIYCESYTKAQFCTATYLYALDSFPVVSAWPIVGAELRLPLPPLQLNTNIGGTGASPSGVVVQYLDMSGTLQTLSPSLYLVDTISKPARIVPQWYQPWPICRPMPNAVQVTFSCGYSDDGTSVPQTFKQAILMLVSYWYRNREAAAEGTFAPIAFAVETLLTASMPGIYS
jgi:uncharacterized phiE125 gp8 family phage protein